MKVINSFIRRLVATTAIVFCLGQAAFALPTGEWWADFYDEIGIITITESSFSFELDEDGAASGFGGPLMEVVEAEAGEPGRMIVGPVVGGKFPYEVVWYYQPDGPRALFFCEAEGYKTLDEARASQPEFDPAEASLFFERDFFAQIDKLPVLPVLSRDALVTLMEEVLRRQRASSDTDPTALMEALMIDKGYHPTKSQVPFEEALQNHLDDPQVKRLLDELNK